MIKLIVGMNDLKTINPELASEWNYEKNGDLKPSDVMCSSRDKVWWKCKNGHEWQAAIYSRKTCGCPYCANKKVLQGFNDLKTVNPELASEWNYEKNGDLKPEDVLPSCNKKIWWKCNKGHEWMAIINDRNRGSGCPYCSGRYAIRGETDLKTLNPELAKEWNYEKNGDLKPEDVTLKCGKKVWWKCNKGHEWQRIIAHRSNGNGCPYCSGKYAAIGETDLVTVNPELASEWNYEKNGDLKPENVTLMSGRKVWWKGKCGHEWQATIASRSDGCGCPYCSNQQVLKGFNDLGTTNPDLVKEWNYEKNGNLKPENYSYGVMKKVWWRCNKGHEWQAAICHRAGVNNSGCPYCSNRLILQGFNDLKTINPEFVKEWNYEKNGDLKPEDITYGSGKKVWWKCEKGHEWQAVVYNRSMKDSGCPICHEFKLEKLTRKYLEQYDLQFDEQVKFDDLRHENLLSYDFGILSNNRYIFMIECQGIQHYEPIDYFGGKKQFKRQQYHDVLKRQYCIDNNLILFMVDYNATEEDIEELVKHIKSLDYEEIRKSVVKVQGEADML